jgi:hypothetical protein
MYIHFLFITFPGSTHTYIILSTCTTDSAGGATCVHMYVNVHVHEMVYECMYVCMYVLMCLVFGVWC